MHVAPESYIDHELYERTRRPVASATTLIREAYVSEEFFAVERERVFASGWVAVGCAEAVRKPGDVLVVDVAGRSVLVVRGGDGALRAFYNVCRHRGTRLLETGEGLVGRFIRCPYHRWAYDLEGRCVGTPLFTDSGIHDNQRAIFATDHAPAFDRRDHGLLGVAVAAFGPVILLNLDPEPEPLADHLGDLPERLAGYRLDEWRLARTADYRVAANYKLVAENFMEYYHLPWVHPGLVKVSPLEAHHRWQGTGMYNGMCTSPIAPDTEDGGWQGLDPLPGLSEDDAVSARFVWLFPNVAISVMPNHLFLIHATPVAAGVTEETTYLLTRPDTVDDPAARDAIDRLAAFWDIVNREDVAIVQRVQEGLASTPFPGGPMCYRFEEPVHRFQNMVADRMVGLRRVPAGDATASTPPLGIAHLERLRCQSVGSAGQPSPGEFTVTKSVLDTLGVGLEPVNAFLAHARPTASEFEAWILDRVGGTIDRRRVARALAISQGAPPDAERRAELERIDSAAPVLSDFDLAFWNENGYVILRDAAPLDACAELERAIWQRLGADPRDQDTWYGGGRQQGVMVQMFHAQGIGEIHASARIHKAFAQLAGTVDLVMTSDRCGFNPPVRPGNPYAGASLHLDLPSLTPPVSPGLQGILYLTDTARDQGALQVIPGFQHRIDSWLASLPAGRDPSLENFAALGEVKSIAARAGDLIIWSAALPHGPQANTSSRPRIVHYLTMYPTPSPAHAIGTVWLPGSVSPST